MKRFASSALASLLLSLGSVATSHAIEILRWERLPLAVPLVVGQERVIFIDRNVRIGLPDSLGAHLRIQSAGGAIYLHASEAIPPTRLQLQDVESGALILLDIAAEPAKAGQPPLEPIRIVESDGTPSRPENPATSRADEDDSGNTAESIGTPARRATPVPVILTRHAAQNLYAPLRTVEPVPGIGRVNLRHNISLGHLAADAAGTRPSAGGLAARRSVDHGGQTLQHISPGTGTRPTGTAGRLRGCHLPAPEPRSGRTCHRHHGSLPRHSRPRPGRIAATENRAH